MNSNPYASPQSPPGRARTVFNVVCVAIETVFLLVQLTLIAIAIYADNPLCFAVSYLFLAGILGVSQFRRWIDERWAD